MVLGRLLPLLPVTCRMQSLAQRACAEHLVDYMQVKHNVDISDRSGHCHCDGVSGLGSNKTLHSMALHQPQQRAKFHSDKQRIHQASLSQSLHSHLQLQEQQNQQLPASDGAQHVYSMCSATVQHSVNNLHVIDDTLLMAAGSVVLLYHMPSKQQRQTLPEQGMGGGIAALAIHPSKQ